MENVVVHLLIKREILFKVYVMLSVIDYHIHVLNYQKI
jgi:hypothetical protein